MEENDLEECWDDTRRISIPSELSVPAELEEDWKAVRVPLPEWLYMAVEGYSLETMALYRLKPHRHRKVIERTGRLAEYWFCTHDSLVWTGLEYKPHVSQTSGKRFRFQAKSVTPSLDEAYSRLEAHRQKHLVTLHNDMQRTEREIAERQAYLERTAQKVRDTAGFVFPR